MNSNWLVLLALLTIAHGCGNSIDATSLRTQASSKTDAPESLGLEQEYTPVVYTELVSQYRSYGLPQGYDHMEGYMTSTVNPGIVHGSRWVYDSSIKWRYLGPLYYVRRTQAPDQVPLYGCVNGTLVGYFESPDIKCENIGSPGIDIRGINNAFGPQTGSFIGYIAKTPGLDRYELTRCVTPNGQMFTVTNRSNCTGANRIGSTIGYGYTGPSQGSNAGGTQKTILPKGLFKIGSGIYYSNGKTSYCAFNSMAHLNWITGRNDAAGIAVFSELPTGQKDDGVCGYGEGLFMAGGGIYYSNGSTAYCGFPNWDTFVRLTRRTNVDGIRVLPGDRKAFPASMKNNGSCG